MGKPKADDEDNATAEDRDKRGEENETDSDSDSDDNLKPEKTKIGEDKDNLRQRSDWFQRRR
jgi:hypothetical protein